MLLLAVAVIIVGCSNKSLTCDFQMDTTEKNGNSVVSCWVPEFEVVCKTDTVLKVGDVLNCKSGDGTSYKITNKEPANSERCEDKLGTWAMVTWGAEDDTWECGCNYNFASIDGKTGKCISHEDECYRLYGANSTWVFTSLLVQSCVCYDDDIVTRWLCSDNEKKPLEY